MFLRRVISRQSCVTDGLPIPSQVACSYQLGLKREDSSSACHIHIDSTKRKVSSGRKCTTECPVVTCDLQRLLSIDNRYDLYRFLKNLILSVRFDDEVKRLVREDGGDLVFPQVITIVDMYSWNYRKEGFYMMQSFAEENHPKDLAAHGNFEPHEILCNSLNEPIRVLNKLLDVASRQSHLKAVVLAQAELLINRIISRGNRSLVDNVNEYLVRDCSPELRGPLLCSSWIAFYLSPFQADQIRAANILKAYEQDMQPHLDLTLSALAQHLLDGRQLNRYYVLLQVFSKYSHRSKTRDLLEKLFRHFYETNNHRGCLTCESLAHELNLDLPHDIRYKCDVIKKSNKTPYSGRSDMKFIF